MKEDSISNLYGRKIPFSLGKLIVLITFKSLSDYPYITLEILPDILEKDPHIYVESHPSKLSSVVNSMETHGRGWGHVSGCGGMWQGVGVSHKGWGHMAGAYVKCQKVKDVNYE